MWVLKPMAMEIAIREAENEMGKFEMHSLKTKPFQFHVDVNAWRLYVAFDVNIVAAIATILFVSFISLLACGAIVI